MGTFSILAKIEFETPIVFILPDGVYAKRVPFYIRSRDETSLLIHDMLVQATNNENNDVELDEETTKLRKMILDPYMDIDLYNSRVQIMFVDENGNQASYIAIGVKYTERISDLFTEFIT